MAGVHRMRGLSKQKSILNRQIIIIFLVFNKYWMMDNVQKVSYCINVPSSQTLVPIKIMKA
jgi:hypothetical protein